MSLFWEIIVIWLLFSLNITSGPAIHRRSRQNQRPGINHFLEIGIIQLKSNKFSAYTIAKNLFTEALFRQF
jgi:hypothetical protein